MIDITEGMTPTEFVDTLNQKFGDLEFLGFGEMIEITTSMSGVEQIAAINANFKLLTFVVGVTGVSFKTLFDGSYETIFQESVSTAVGDPVETLPDTESLVGKEIMATDTYIVMMGATGDITIENKVITGLGGLKGYYNPAPTAPIGIYVHCVTGELGKVIVRNCIVRNIDSCGIEVVGAKEILFENCHVENCNFVAYTPVSTNKITMINCTSKLTRMHVESVSTLEDGWIRMKNCRATGIEQYMTRWWGAGRGIFIGLKATGNPAYDYYIGQTEGYMFYMQTGGYYSAGTRIVKAAFADVAYTHGRDVIVFSKTISVDNSVDKVYFAKVVPVDVHYVDIGYDPDGVLASPDVIIHELINCN